MTAGELLFTMNKKSKRRGRPKKKWTQAMTACDLGISQAAVSRALTIDRAIKAFPELTGFKGAEILRIVRMARQIEKEEKRKGGEPSARGKK